MNKYLSNKNLARYIILLNIINEDFAVFQRSDTNLVIEIMLEVL